MRNAGDNLTGGTGRCLLQACVLHCYLLPITSNSRVLAGFSVLLQRYPDAEGDFGAFVGGAEDVQAAVHAGEELDAAVQIGKADVLSFDHGPVVGAADPLPDACQLFLRNADAVVPDPDVKEPVPDLRRKADVEGPVAVEAVLTAVFQQGLEGEPGNAAEIGVVLGMDLDIDELLIPQPDQAYVILDEFQLFFQRPICLPGAENRPDNIGKSNQRILQFRSLQHEGHVADGGQSIVDKVGTDLGLQGFNFQICSFPFVLLFLQQEHIYVIQHFVELFANKRNFIGTFVINGHSGI